MSTDSLSLSDIPLYLFPVSVLILYLSLLLIFIHFDIICIMRNKTPEEIAKAKSNIRISLIVNLLIVVVTFLYKVGLYYRNKFTRRRNIIPQMLHIDESVGSDENNMYY